MQRTSSLALAGLGVLAIGPLALIAGRYAPLAGVPAVLLALAARLVPAPETAGRTGRALDGLCACATAGVLARGIGDYLVPGYPRLAGVVVLVLLGLLVFARTAIPDVLAWFGIGLGALAAVLFTGAGLGIAPPSHAPEAVHPALLVPAAVLLLGAAAGVPRGPGRGFPWWLAGAALGFGALAWVAQYQLGAARTGFSPAPLTDALEVANAGELTPVLVVALVLALAIGAHGQLDLAAERFPAWSPALGGIAVVFAGQLGGLVVCAVLVLTRFAYLGWSAIRGELP
ncbi:hypothetical protein [Sciscionella marina]|uniref:hypothetical protein n=1 Tax=Sciscionella marina TaxID=508770 RepID=UPI0003751A90|nr:hypothetical protein [Sciscionella marina]